MNGERSTGIFPAVLFAVSGVLALALAAGGYWFHRHEVETIRDAKYAELKAIADLKIGQITSWRKERLADAHLHSSGKIRTDVLEWLQKRDGSVAAGILARLRAIVREEDSYQDIIVAGVDGGVVFALCPRLTGLDATARDLVARALASREAIFGDFFRCPDCVEIHLDVAAPILDREVPVAVLILRSDVERNLYPLIRSWPMPSKSAETLLVRQDGDAVLFLNQIRHLPDAALTLRIPRSCTDVPAIQASLGKTGIFEGHDYRGVQVLSDIRTVPGSPWFMVAKVDLEEILAEARYRGRLVLALVALGISLAAFMAAFAGSYRRKNLYRGLYFAERKQRETQEELRATLYGIGDGVLSTDAAARVRRMNPMAEWLTGWTEPRALGKSIAEVFRIINEDTRAAVEDPVQRVLREGVVVGLANHSLLIARDGTERPIADSGAPLLDEKGEVIGVVLVFRDQTKDRHAERILRESEARFRMLYEQAPVPYQALDKEGRLLEVNAAWLAELGYAREDVIGKWFGDFLDDPQLFSRRFEALQATGESHGDEWDMKCRDGRRITASFEGRIGDALSHWVFVNITARKSLESQLLQAQKMDSVGRLAGGVAHDFNNMLTLIINYAEMARQDATPAELQHYLKEILNAGRHSADLTRQLLAFARKQTIQPVAVTLNDIVSGMLNLLRRLIGENIEFFWEPGASLWKIRIDPAQIDQVLVNLTVNARDAISGVGKITIATANAALDADYCAGHIGSVPGDYVLLSVSDNGCGMGGEILEHLFEPFFTTKELGKGTGMGLATVYGIVRQNHAHIDVESEAGKGTTFRIYLPRFIGEESPSPNSGAVAVRQKNSETVLLVEDERPILLLCKDMLEWQGYRVLAADKPTAAFRLAQECGETIHLLITDVVMPEMNGRELSERLSALRPDLKTLFMSGYTADVIAHERVLEKNVHFLQKPFSLDTLAQKVREVLDH